MKLVRSSKPRVQNLKKINLAPIMKLERYFLLLLAALAGPTYAEPRDLILVAGQSNAVGFDAYATEFIPETGDKDILFWWRVGDPPPDEFDVESGGRWTHLQPQPRGTPMDPKSADSQKKTRQYGNFKKPEGGFGPEVGLARTLRAKEGKSPAIVKVAFSGTGLTTDWNPEDTGASGACYHALVNETRKAIAAAQSQGTSLRLRAVVWIQGESDATPATAPHYETNLRHMLTRLRSDLEAPKLIAIVGVNTRFGNGNNPHMPQIIAAQQALATKDKLCFYLDTAGAETLPPSHTHFTAQGTLEIGKRAADLLLLSTTLK